MGRLDGKVAFVTGAARGQGRSHAIRLAQEGADIIASDICTEIETSPFPLATEAQLAETAKLVEELDRRIITGVADVREQGALDELVERGLSEFGRIDIALGNAGILSYNDVWALSDAQWDEMIDINLKGVWRTVKAVTPAMIEAGNGGSIVLTSSIYGLNGSATLAHYSAAKYGVVGLAQSAALELAPHMIRVNTVHPTFVNTDMIHNRSLYKQFFPNIENPTREQFAEAATSLNTLPVPWVEPVDISNAVLWLASDESRYVTGIGIPVDAGFLIKHNVGAWIEQ